MKKIISLVFTGALIASAAGPQIFKGIVTDSMCGKDHTMMKVNPDSKCVVECARHGSRYALFDGKTAYVLSDQKTPEQFAGKKVRINGTLYEKTGILKVDSIMSDGVAPTQPANSHTNH